jgi:hypothetical protein
MKADWISNEVFPMSEKKYCRFGGVYRLSPSDYHSTMPSYHQVAAHIAFITPLHRVVLNSSHGLRI